MLHARCRSEIKSAERRYAQMNADLKQEIWVAWRSMLIAMQTMREPDRNLERCHRNDMTTQTAVAIPPGRIDAIGSAAHRRQAGFVRTRLGFVRARTSTLPSGRYVGREYVCPRITPRNRMYSGISALSLHSPYWRASRSRAATTSAARRAISRRWDIDPFVGGYPMPRPTAASAAPPSRSSPNSPVAMVVLVLIRNVDPHAIPRLDLPAS